MMNWVTIKDLVIVLPSSACTTNLKMVITVHTSEISHLSGVAK